METPDYLTYKKTKQQYQEQDIKKEHKSQTQKIKVLGIVFALSFILCFLIIINITGSLSAKVDIEDDYQSAEILDEDSPIEQKSTIDRRLTNLYNEEIGLSKARAVKRDDDIIDPDKYKEMQNEQEEILREKTSTLEIEDNKKDEKEIKKEAPKPNTEATYTPSFIRVLVGRYSTLEEAKASQELIRNSEGFEAVSPFIRKMGDFYTIQVGSYTNPEVAKSVATKLSKSNYNVWVLEN